MTDGEEGGETSGRSKGVNYRMKISDDVMDDLYSARGKLKIDLVRRVVDKLKKDKGN